MSDTETAGVLASAFMPGNGNISDNLQLLAFVQLAQATCDSHSSAIQTRTIVDNYGFWRRTSTEKTCSVCREEWPCAAFKKAAEYLKLRTEVLL